MKLTLRKQNSAPFRLLSREQKAKVEAALASKGDTPRKPHIAGGGSPENPNRWEPSERDIQQIEFLAGTGLNGEEIADVIGVSYATLRRRKDEIEQLELAIKRGRSRGKTLVVNKLFEMATKGNDGAGNLGAICFYLKNHGWSDNANINIGNKDGVPFRSDSVGVTLDPKERVARLAQLLNTARARGAGQTPDSDE